jgi:phosphonate transport system substrate-binding protein
MLRGSCGFGIVRSIDVARGRTRLAELCALLTQELGTLFVPHHAPSYGALVESLDAGDIALAWVPPLACIRIEESKKGSVLALPVRRGAVSYRAALIAHATHAQAPKTLDELRGRRVAWVDRDSSSGYHVPRLFLEGAGLSAGAFSEERFLGSHSNVVAAVVGGAVDIGATYCAIASAADSGSYVAQTAGADPPLPRGPWSAAVGAPPPLRILATTGAIPNDAIVASARLPTDTRLAVLRWVLAPRGSRAQEICLDLFGAEGFRTSQATHFDPLRRLVAIAETRMKSGLS